MLTKRIIPCLDVDAGRVVKGMSFVKLRDAGDPVELAVAYNDAGADELVFLDITASAHGRNTIVDVVSRVSEALFIPLTVGGGIRSVADAQRLLRAGADKISLNTAAVQRPELVAEASEHFGRQCIVVAIDARRVRPDAPTSPHNVPARLALTPGSRWEVFTHGGRTSTGIDAVAWARNVTELGAGELLLTSMDEDGQQAGYDLALTSATSEAVPVPVIASGGAGSLEHLYQAFTQGKADAILAATIFHFGVYTIGQAKEYLEKLGLPVRR